MNHVMYRDRAAGEGPSPNIWHDCPILQMLEDPGVGFGRHWDFADYAATATTVHNKHGLPTFEGDCAITGMAEKGGGISLLATTENEDGAIELCGGTCAPFVIAAATADQTKLWFEARVKKNTIADSIGSCFVGLVSQGAAIDAFFANGGADYADVDLLGFHMPEADGDVCEVNAQKTGADFDLLKADMITMVADTWINLGFKLDPTRSGDKRLAFYVDGVEQDYYIGQASGDQTMYIGDTTNFPGGEEMSPALVVKAGSASDLYLYCKWVRCFQLY